MEMKNTATEANGTYSRFQVFQGQLEASGKIQKTKSVGMAYLKDGHNTFTLRLWTFVNEKFYLIPSNDSPTKYLIMTREPNKNPNSKNKYFWNIVGNGDVDSVRGIVALQFDLFDKFIYVNIYPEASVQSVKLPPPIFDEIVAA